MKVKVELDIEQDDARLLAAFAYERFYTLLYSPTSTYPDLQGAKAEAWMHIHRALENAYTP